MDPVRRTTLPALVAEEIGRNIMRGNFKPGEKLPTEAELSKQLEVGRATIREALRIMEGQGWIEFKFSKGAYVMNNPNVSEKMSASLQKEQLLELLEYEICQLKEEGKDITVEIEGRIQELKKKGSLEDIEKFYDGLENLEERTDFKYKEPSELEDIKKEAPGGKTAFLQILDKDVLYNKIDGAWFGRCIGCLLGKPVEGWPLKKIEDYLKATDSYPLRDYFPYLPNKVTNSEHTLRLKACTKGNISYMARDDDLDYTILNLKLVQEKGVPPHQRSS